MTDLLRYPDPPGLRVFPPVNEPDPEPTPQGQAAVVRRLTRCDDQRDSRRPNDATAALPGTAEKIAVMAERVAAGRAAFHPDDLTVEDCERLGYSCTVDKNGYCQWNRPVSEETRRQLILAAVEALRQRGRMNRGRRKVG